MNEELQQRANEALIRMIEGLENAADFTVEQAPLVVQELLAWRLTWSLIWFTFWSFVLISWWLIAAKVKKKANGCEDLKDSDKL